MSTQDCTVTYWLEAEEAVGSYISIAIYRNDIISIAIYRNDIQIKKRKFTH